MESPQPTLKSIKMVQLGEPVDLLEKEYGITEESEESEEYEDVMVHYFQPGEKIAVVASVWRGKVHSATYWHVDENSDPDAELKHVAMAYSNGKEWDELEPGYLYWTKDGKYQLRCSAVPAITVETIEFSRGRVSLHQKESSRESTKPADPTN